jgi:hypothetical protein
MYNVKFTRSLIVIFLLALLLPVFVSRAVHPATPQAPARKAVVVELFTSEGCSSCPPADALLGRLRQQKFADGVEVIPLGLHVDYWDFQGWTDRFSSAAYTERQQKYAHRFHTEGPYTPQMVVDGASQFVGSDTSRAGAAIVQAGMRQAAADVQISAAGEDKVQVSIKAPKGNSSEVILAYTEDNLATKIGGGENNGRELRHSAVVRELRSIGHLENGVFEAALAVKLKKGWKRNDLRIVVFAQEPNNGPIDGAASLPLGTSAPASER